MDINYPFLKDELALAEIRKHKWIESEKRGVEIGFASAAVDWVRNHGHAWLKYRRSLEPSAERLPYNKNRTRLTKRKRNFFNGKA